MKSEVFVAAAVQAAPVFLDRDATVEKAVGLIEAAANEGAKRSPKPGDSTGLSVTDKRPLVSWYKPNDYRQNEPLLSVTTTGYSAEIISSCVLKSVRNDFYKGYIVFVCNAWPPPCILLNPWSLHPVSNRPLSATHGIFTTNYAFSRT